MLELRKFVAPEFILGQGALDLVGQYATNFGARKVLVVTDEGVLDCGVANRVCDNLRQEGIELTIFSELSPNPRAEEVMNGAEHYLSEGCDVIVSVGGGSSMDCAKAIGIVTTNKKHVLEFEGIDNVEIPGPPLICLPTTAGTSADVSQFAIVTNLHEQVKIAIVSKTVVPDVALIDPVATLTMPPYLTACTGIDALVHAFEAYVSTAHAPIFDHYALDAVKLLFHYLPAVLKDPDNLELRGKVTLASLEAGLAFSNASLGAVHAMAHSCGGLLDIPHGECNAILLDHVVKYNFAEAAERYRDIAGKIGVQVLGRSDSEVELDLLDRIRQLKRDVGIEIGLKAKGANRADIAELARKAVKDPCMVTNPRVPNRRDIEVIYEEAL